jgi:hypothetical protein
MNALAPSPWRVGRKVGRTIYDANDQLIGVMDTPELAKRVVEAVNLAEPARVGAVDEEGKREAALLWAAQHAPPS